MNPAGGSRWAGRVRRQLAFTLVGLVALAGFVRMYLAHWREGALLLGGALLLAAVLRVLVPEDRCGLLRIRARPVDVLLYGVLGIIILVIAWTIRRGPFG